MAEQIAKLTTHQNLTDAIITTMGESLALQQALMQIPSYDGINMELKSFLQDVETGHASCPSGNRDRFSAGVVDCAMLLATW